MNVKEQIDRIIRKRREERLPKIAQQLEFLRMVKEKVARFDDQLGGIHNQIGCLGFELEKDSDFQARLMAVSTNEVKRLLDVQVRKLEILQKRFSRDAVQIAFIGFERQGKSCFLQSISGLDNKVIPAYSGTSCTGAVSVIHNENKDLEVHVEFYNMAEFLGIVQEKINKFFSKNTYVVRSLQDLSELDLSNYDTTDVSIATEFGKFKEAYIEHMADYVDLIGRDKSIFTDKNQIIQHVSQYEEFDSVPEDDNQCLYEKKCRKDYNGNEVVVWSKKYYKYIAVKSVDIYTRFQDDRVSDAKLVLVDTIGMGDATNAVKIEEEMFRVLREDCDAAVNVFKPQANGDSFNTHQNDILKKIGKELEGREPYKWIYYVLNRVDRGVGLNGNAVQGVKDQIEKSFSNLSNKPVAKVLDINAIDADEVGEKLLTSLLDLVENNLDDIDSNLMKDANKTAEDLYRSFSQFVESASKVMSGSKFTNTNEEKLFKNKIEELCYPRALFDLKKEYEQKKDVPCKDIQEGLNKLIDGLLDKMSSVEEIDKKVQRADSCKTNDIFKHFIEQYRGVVIDAFKGLNNDVVISLQEDVKKKLIKVLFEEAKLGNIILQGVSTDKGATQEWLKCLLSECIDVQSYPKLHSVLSSIADFRLGIEGLLEYNVVKCLDPIDSDKEGFERMDNSKFPIDEQAQEIWETLIHRASPVNDAFRRWVDSFSLIPSHSFFAIVKQIRFQMVDGDEKMKEEIEDFYRNNRLQIWRDDFANLAEHNSFLGSWNSVCRDLTEICVKSRFFVEFNS